MGYLKDMAEGTIYTASPAPEIKAQPNDRIAIRIMTKEPELALPFYDASSSSTGVDAGLYTVDSEGNIDFPVLGRLAVGGRSLEDIRDEITTKIQEKGYIKEPTVKVSLDNFTVTVIGQTEQSVIKVENNSINIFEVVAKSNLLPAEANIKNVMVVRTEEGKRYSYTVNLQSKDVFDSPAYYLRQNDIVYFKPRGVQLSPTGETVLKVFSSTFSFITSIGYVSWWLNGRR
jgi:polysaccharide export outer membrane protein